MIFEATLKSKITILDSLVLLACQNDVNCLICPILTYFMLSLQVDKLFSPTSLWTVSTKKEIESIIVKYD